MRHIRWCASFFCPHTTNCLHSGGVGWGELAQDVQKARDCRGGGLGVEDAVGDVVGPINGTCAEQGVEDLSWH